MHERSCTQHLAALNGVRHVVVRAPPAVGRRGVSDRKRPRSPGCDRSEPVEVEVEAKVKRRTLVSPMASTTYLLDLPQEVLLCICDQLPAETLWTRLRSVSWRFRLLVQDAFYWRHRLRRRKFDVDVNALKRHSLTSIAKMCVRAEEETRIWSERVGGHGIASEFRADAADNLAVVDCLEFWERGDAFWLVSGSRDRAIRIWNAYDLKRPILTRFDAHQCWIKSVQPLSPSQLLSFGFDGSVCLWSFSSNSNSDSDDDLVRVGTTSLKSTVTQISVTPERLFVVCADNRIRVIALTPTLMLCTTVSYFKAQTTAIAVGADAKALFIANRHGWLCRLATDSWHKSAAQKHCSPILSLCVGGKKLFAGFASGELSVFDLSLHVLQTVQVFSANIAITKTFTSIATLVCVSKGGSVVVLLIQDLERLFAGSAGFSPTAFATLHGRVAFVHPDSELRALVS